MHEVVPPQIKTAAVAQVVSGGLSILMAWLGSCMVGSFCGIATLGFGGQFCGLLPFLLIPIGIMEVGVGIFGLMNPREAASAMRIVSFVEMGSILVGGLTSAIVGGVVYRMLGQDEVVGYLEG